MLSLPPTCSSTSTAERSEGSLEPLPLMNSTAAKRAVRLKGPTRFTSTPCWHSSLTTSVCPWEQALQ